jgi:hypothetical protein
MPARLWRTNKKSRRHNRVRLDDSRCLQCGSLRIQPCRRNGCHCWLVQQCLAIGPSETPDEQAGWQGGRTRLAPRRGTVRRSERNFDTEVGCTTPSSATATMVQKSWEFLGMGPGNVIPAKAVSRNAGQPRNWVPAFAGTTDAKNVLPGHSCNS